MSSRISRAGDKLAAALAHFKLAPRLAKAQAIDVGASTGGFTALLLERGCAHVTAIDVGHDQLHPALRGDPRITLLERAHMKTLPLTTAPGPFDFFTVDVSFIAARTMLRPLAFRLRPGAEGVILLKPQFELPSSQVKGGDVSDPQLRRRALELLRDKAEQLGFELVEHLDSPVAGGEGTVEILTHLRFRGRSAAMPQPGERRSRAAARPARTTARPDRARLFLVAPPGTEAIVAAEARRVLPEAAVTDTDGGVELVGPPALIARANLHLRLPSRVVLRLGEVEAREFGRLRRGVAALPWAAYLPRGAAITIRAASSRSRLYHTGAIAETIALAAQDAVDATLAPRAKGAVEEDTADGAREDDATHEASFLVLVRGREDRFTISLDTSGALLHRRGWRARGGQAPLRETLAAALLALAEHAPDEPLCDPMCGSGTIAIEAAHAAIGRAPGLDRRFAFERFAAHDEAAWAELRDEARRNERPRPLAIVAADADPAQLEIARKNAELAGVATLIGFRTATLDELEPHAARGLVVTNPPYGRRVGAHGAAPLGALYAGLGRMLRGRWSAWRAAVLVEDRARLSTLGLDGRRAQPLSNGGLRVWVGRR